jgi:hypothetical protein
MFITGILAAWSFSTTSLGGTPTAQTKSEVFSSMMTSMSWGRVPFGAQQRHLASSMDRSQVMGDSCRHSLTFGVIVVCGSCCSSNCRKEQVNAKGKVRAREVGLDLPNLSSEVVGGVSYTPYKRRRRKGGGQHSAMSRSEPEWEEEES